MEEKKSSEESKASSYQLRGPLKNLKPGNVNNYEKEQNQQADAFEYKYKMEKYKNDKPYSSSDSESLEIGSHSRKDFKKDESDLCSLS